MPRPRKPRSARDWADKVWNREVPLREVPEGYYWNAYSILRDRRYLLSKAMERVNGILEGKV